MQNPEPSTCPFCTGHKLPCTGISKGAPKVFGPTDEAEYAIYCSECGASSGRHPDLEKAIAAWNRRASGWTRIEDCPEAWKDGRWLLAYRNSYSSIVMKDPYAIISLASVGLWVHNNGYGPAAIEYYTHIMPLPAVPEE